jgi:hypothetical protein
MLTIHHPLFFSKPEKVQSSPPSENEEEVVAKSDNDDAEGAKVLY